MADNSSRIRFIAVYADYYEDREGTEQDIEDIVGEDCGHGSFVNEKGTVISGVRMLYQDGTVPEENRFSNPFSGPFDRYHHEVSMNFVLVGMDDYSEEEWNRINRMTSEDQQEYFEEHPIEYRSLTKEEVLQCADLLRTVSYPEKTLFLGGSQTYSELPEEVKGRLDGWMLRHASFVVRGFEGADTLMQKYLRENGYKKVYDIDDIVRYGIGRWSEVKCNVSSVPERYSSEWYHVTNEVITRIADEGLMLWDGESPETRESIISLREKGKPVSVFRTNGPWCWEEKTNKSYCSISEDSLKEELKRYEEEEQVSIKAAVQRCPRAAEALGLKRDESFLLYKVATAKQERIRERTSAYSPFLSFTDVLATIRDEMISQDPTMAKPVYVLEKWTSKGDFNLSFFRFKDELIEVEPPDEDYHMEQTARFELEGDEVTRFCLLNSKKTEKGKNGNIIVCYNRTKSEEREN